MMEKYNSYDTEKTEVRNLPVTSLEEWCMQKLLKYMQLAMKITFPNMIKISHTYKVGKFICQLLTSICVQQFSMKFLFHLKKKSLKTTIDSGEA